MGTNSTQIDEKNDKKWGLLCKIRVNRGRCEFCHPDRLNSILYKTPVFYLFLFISILIY